ncbi:histidinol-phosphatase [Streptomyces megasporus]|uniref:histidinol-phosphatase n=1 Tax=Streptomyces megasporus TaxID=44060 RepID=UPI00056C3632|nr:histidinol-phosphatase [Streptomyces megasporus]
MPTPEDLALARELADIADAVTVERFRARDLEVRRKPDRTPVTDADLAVEKAVRAAVEERRPGDALFGEEQGGEITRGRTWVVDPIDGTKNFLRGVPVWATLVALVEDGRPTVGVVSAPALRKRWWAGLGQGAWTAGPDGPVALRVSEVEHLADAYLSTTELRTWAACQARDRYLRLADSCWQDRAFGDFLQYCLVAEGTIDLVAEPIVSPWDVAAVRILVEEAGGVCTDLDGRDPLEGTGVLAGNPRLHAAALSLVSARRGGGEGDREPNR